MKSSVNPGTWSGWDLRVKDQQFDTKMQLLLNQLSQFGTQTQQQLSSAPYLAGILNGSALLTKIALSTKVVDLGVITTDQTVNSGGGFLTYIRLSSAVTQARTITIQNLAQGSILVINPNITANILTMKLAITDPSSNTYTAEAWLTSSGATLDLVAAGAVLAAAEWIFIGATGFVGTSSSPRLITYYR